MNRRRIVVENSWFKCYGDGWTGIITPEAFCHPAKFSRALIRRIYAHAVEEGWVEAGSVIIDPFGGVALGGLEAMRCGLHWVGVELEDRFVQLGQQNIDLWNSRYAEQMPNWGSAVIVQGDSRRLGEVLAEAQLCLSSPPFSTSLGSRAGGGGCLNPANKEKYKNTGMANWKWGQSDYGQTGGNLGNLPDTGFEAALALGSPPYGVLDVGGRGGEGPGSAGAPNARKADGASKEASGIGYGSEPGQLAQMPEGDLVAVVRTLDNRRNARYNTIGGEHNAESDCIANGADNQGLSRGRLGPHSGHKVQCPRQDHPDKVEESRNKNTLIPGSRQGIISAGQEDNTLLEGQEATCRDGGQESGQSVRPESLSLEGRQKQTRLSQGSGKGEVRGVRGETQPGDTSQGLRPLQQRSGELAGALCQLSHETPQASLLGCYEGREGATKVKWANELAQGVAGQLATLPEGDHAAALEAGPLYAGCLDNPAQRRDYTGTGGPIDSRVGCEEALETGAETGRAQCAISSPPFEGSLNNGLRESDREKYAEFARAGRGVGTDYGTTPGQLGQQQGSTFWAASREILEEVYKVLAPGAHAIWVVKAFVRNKAIVDFPGQWRELCESVGFRTLHEHHAILTEDRGAQHTLDGGLDVRQVKRASFFKHLHESKYPHLAINHEVVLCMVKPS